MKRILALLCIVLLLAPAGALALTGQNYKTFQTYYTANVDFINKNDNRHLLPMLLSQRNSGKDDGRTYYDLLGDVLSVSVVTDAQGVIESCSITLTAPANMEYGSAVYNDFAISGYHSYAFLMAMDTHTDPAQRYQLVSDVVEGLKSGGGFYSRQLDAYTLTCTRGDGKATLDFENGATPSASPSSNPDATPAPSDNGGDGGDGGDTADDYIG